MRNATARYSERQALAPTNARPQTSTKYRSACSHNERGTMMNGLKCFCVAEQSWEPALAWLLAAALIMTNPAAAELLIIGNDEKIT